MSTPMRKRAVVDRVISRTLARRPLRCQGSPSSLPPSPCPRSVDGRERAFRAREPEDHLHRAVEVGRRDQLRARFPPSVLIQADETIE
jgi:hypothetical protein